MDKIFTPQKELEIKEELLSVHALNPFIANNSSARGYMFSSHFSQCLALRKGEEHIIQSGLEKEFRENTFSKVADRDYRVVKVIKRYSGLDSQSVDKVVEIILLVEDIGTYELDYISIPYYHKLHQYFGFTYIKNDDLLNNIRTGDILPKDTILAKAPGINNNNGYTYGLNANMCLLNLPETTEDGVVVSESFVKKLAYDTFETRIVEFGSKNFPLNMYGDDKVYKAFPEIGDLISEDSVIMVLRNYDEDIPAALTSINDVREFNPMFDKAVYVKAPGEIKNINGEEIKYGEIVDIKVYTSNKWKKDLYTDVGDGIEKYSNSLKLFHKQILDAYEEVKQDNYKRYKNYDVKISEKLHKLIVDSICLYNPNKNNIAYSSKNELLDTVRIEFTIAYAGTIPVVGSKITDHHGAKGVIVEIRPDDKMPYTMINGEKVVSDIVMDPSSLVSRMNIGRVYEHYFCAISRKTQYEIKKAMGGVKPIDKYTDKELQNGFNVLLGLLQIIGTEQYEGYKSIKDIKQIKEILHECIYQEVFILYKVSSKKKPYQIVKEVKGTIYEPEINKCIIPTDNGEITTKEDIMIAPLYTLLLGKTAENYLSVASAKLNHFGLPIGVDSATRNYLPYRSSPTKVISETESRLYLSYVSRRGIAELKDRANSIPTHEHIYKTILEADYPTNIENVVDRTKVPFGEDSALELVNNIFNSAGISIEYNDPNK